jgi:hypothetical protein
MGARTEIFVDHSNSRFYIGIDSVLDTSEYPTISDNCLLARIMQIMTYRNLDIYTKHEKSNDMKPRKNRVFCRDCERNKMLFDTEKKANNFIAFNQDEIKAETGFAPQRSYYCIFCLGWHVTSIKEEIGISKNEVLLEKYLREKEEKKERKKTVPEKKENKVSEKDRFSNEDMLGFLKLKLENEIKTLDANQKEILLTEKIDLLKKEIEEFNVITGKARLKELRLSLEIVYIVRKQYGFDKKNKIYEESKERQLEEWRIWLEKLGYDNEK